MVKPGPNRDGRAARKAGRGHRGTGRRDAESLLGAGDGPVAQLRYGRLETGGKHLRHHCVPGVGIAWVVTRK